MGRSALHRLGGVVLIGVGIAISAGSAFGQATPAIDDFPCAGPARTTTFFEELGARAGDDAASPEASASLGLAEHFPMLTDIPTNADVEAVMATLATLNACRNAGDFARLSALFTHDYWRREVGSDEIAPAKAAEFAEMVDATPTRPVEQIARRESLGDARLLPDGRIAGFFREDGRDLDDTQLVAFREVDGRWLIDEVVFVDELDVFGTPNATGATPTT